MGKYISAEGYPRPVQKQAPCSEHISMVGFADLHGSFIPPVIVYQSESKTSEISVGELEDWREASVSYTDTGFMTRKLWFKVLTKHILLHCKERVILLKFNYCMCVCFFFFFCKYVFGY